MDTIDRPETAAYSPLPGAAAAPAPARAEAAWTAGAVAVAAAACGGLFWSALPARRAQPAAVPVPAGAYVAEPEDAPEAPVLPPAPQAEGRPVAQTAYASSGAPASASQAMSAAPELERAAAEASLAAAGGLAWARVQASQSWVWPAGLDNFTRGPLPDFRRQRLVGWFPDAPRGQQLLYEVRQEDGSSRRVYEQDLQAALHPDQPRAAFAFAAAAPAVGDPETAARFAAQLAAIQAREREALRQQEHATSVRDVSQAGSRPMAELTFSDGHKEVVPYDPLVFDLKGRGAKTSERKVMFDLIGTHRVDKTQWMQDLEGDTGMLVFDSTRSGRSGKSGSEVFGDRTDLDGKGAPDGYIDGFHALRALAEKAAREGVIPAQALRSGVLDAPALAAMEKAYGLRMKVGGFNAPAISLARAGVSAIALSSSDARRVRDFDGRGNDVLLQPGALFRRADGTTGAYMNVFLAARTDNLGLDASARY